MTATTRSRVTFMHDDEYLVRGTLDTMEALKILVDCMEEDCQTEERLWGVSPISIPVDGDPLAPTAEDCRIQVGLIAEWCHERLRHAQPGRWRKVPTRPESLERDDGYAWMLYPANPGCGSFDGIYFRAW